MIGSVARGAVKVAAAALDEVRPSSRGVVVLLYHRVGGTSGTQLDLPTDLFVRQMEMLAERGTVTTLDRALRSLTTPAVPSEDPVVITFDDGTADFSDTVVPTLARLGLPATLYVATHFIESGRRFPHDGIPLSWRAIIEALSTGCVEIGSHTHTHALLDRVGAKQVRDELDRSIELVEHRVGVRPVDFAYPKAIAGSGAVEAHIRLRFRSAAVGGSRSNPYGRSNLYRLARTPIQAADGMRWFRRKLDGGMALEEAIRGHANRIRYARSDS
jgi:hypothetical protein